jgi:hypothetical protein
MCGFERLDAIAQRIVNRVAADAGRLGGTAPAAKWKGEKTGDRSRR